MKVLLIEDNDSKAGVISNFMQANGVNGSNILRARNMSEFAAHLSQDIGLFVIDIKIPSMDGVALSENGEAILASIVEAGKDDALLIAISSYPNDFPKLRERFEARGCILADFQKKESWQSTLKHLLIQIKKNTRFDFLIFCALQVERSPYQVLFPNGNRIVRLGLQCYDIELGGRTGSVIQLPKMGLVNAAIVSGVCIDRFRPLVVGMSGICGGFSGQSRIGQLIVSAMAYEYQSGKWAEDGFSHEPYQVATEHNLLAKLESVIEYAGLLPELESGYMGCRPSEPAPPKTGIFTSGSAVIADQKFMDQIREAHRKVDALDMEVFSIHRASQISSNPPACICAKTVVDLGNGQKNDDLHGYGSHISAKFVAKGISTFFE